MTSKDDCNVCPEGTFCPVGSAAAANCIAGTYNHQAGQEACFKCDAGTFQDTEGATACKPCYPGYFCPEGSATPIPCSGGTYGNSSSLQERGECQIVQPGFWAPTGSALPEPCFSGFICPGHAKDTEFHGSKPKIIAVGRTTVEREEEVEVVVEEEEPSPDPRFLPKVQNFLKDRFHNIFEMWVFFDRHDNWCVSVDDVKELCKQLLPEAAGVKLAEIALVMDFKKQLDEAYRKCSRYERQRVEARAGRHARLPQQVGLPRQPRQPRPRQLVGDEEASEVVHLPEALCPYARLVEVHAADVGHRRHPPAELDVLQDVAAPRLEQQLRVLMCRRRRQPDAARERARRGGGALKRDAAHNLRDQRP